MFRFYCTICKKVKRVQQVPANIQLDYTTTNPENRLGTCNFHNSITRTRYRSNHQIANDKPHNVRFRFRNARVGKTIKEVIVTSSKKGKK